MSVEGPYAPSLLSTVTGIRSRSRLVKRTLAALVRVFVALALVLFSASRESLGAESNPPPSVTSQIEDTNSLEVLRAVLQLQEKLRETQLAIERGRQETKEGIAQQAQVLSNGLLTMQDTFSAQRARDLEAMQSSNETILIVGGVFTALGFLMMLMMIFFQWRMNRGLAQITAALPVSVRLGPGSVVAALGPANQPNVPLLGPIAQQEERNHEPMQSSEPAVRPRKEPRRSNQRQLYPNPADSRRRRQFNAALIVGLIFALLLGLLLYLMHMQRPI